MAGEYQPLERTIPASADLSAFQYRGVTIDSAGSAGTFANPVGAAASTPVYGILTNKPGAASRGARVCVSGVTKMEAGSAVAIGDLVLVVGQAGRGVGIAPSTAGTHWVVGRAMTRAAASGDIFEVAVNPFFYLRP